MKTMQYASMGGGAVIVWVAVPVRSAFGVRK